MAEQIAAFDVEVPRPDEKHVLNEIMADIQGVLNRYTLKPPMVVNAIALSLARTIVDNRIADPGALLSAFQKVTLRMVAAIETQQRGASGARG